MDIEKLEGRELDAKVAEKIFDRPPSYYQCPHFDYKGRMLSFCSCPDLPRYSRDIAVAWQVHQTACEWLFSKRRMYLKNLQRAVSQRIAGHASVLESTRISWPDVMIFLQPEDFCRAALMVVEAG